MFADGFVTVGAFDQIRQDQLFGSPETTLAKATTTFFGKRGHESLICNNVIDFNPFDEAFQERVFGQIRKNFFGQIFGFDNKLRVVK